MKIIHQNKKEKNEENAFWMRSGMALFLSPVPLNERTYTKKQKRCIQEVRERDR